MRKEFPQITWDERLQADWLRIVALAVEEDLGESGDWTTRALVPADAPARAAVAARKEGVVAGLPGAASALEQIDSRLRWSARIDDGQVLRPGDRVALVEGPAASLLTAERLVLNLLGHLSGIATLARRYVEAVAGTRARIYDTRKTTPGWRRLEKYAVRCGGGWNHRGGLFEAILIKDNHLAVGAAASGGAGYTPAEAVRRARRFLAERAPSSVRDTMIVEVEVDRLEQLKEVLPARPDIVLLDNMTPDELRQAVALRDARHPQVELEASGGVALETVRAIAETGVERISVGALTHSAESLDLGLDWL
jgi:nicotinate-nucleotide pyrophosphorylase (carboxylating)